MKKISVPQSVKNLFSLKYTKTVVATTLLLLTLLNFYITFTNKKVVYQSNAWVTDQSAEAICQDSGNAGIRVSFTNKETDNETDMSVIVLDNQTGKTIDLGSIAAQETKTGVIDTGTSSITANTVQFQLKWSSGRNGTDSRTVSYTAKQCTSQITPTTEPSATITPEISPTYSTTPTITITPTIIVTVSVTITPTVSITTTTTPSSTPTRLPSPTVTTTTTPTTIPTGTPQPTSTPYPTYTGYPTATPTPTSIIIVVNNTNTPTPSSATTPVPSIPVAGSPISWIMIFIPIALVTFGLVF